MITKNVLAWLTARKSAQFLFLLDWTLWKLRGVSILTFCFMYLPLMRHFWHHKTCGAAGGGKKRLSEPIIKRRKGKWGACCHSRKLRATAAAQTIGRDPPAMSCWARYPIAQENGNFGFKCWISQWIQHSLLPHKHWGCYRTPNFLINQSCMPLSRIKTAAVRNVILKYNEWAPFSYHPACIAWSALLIKVAVATKVCSKN